jgi:anaerobic magnesium-protoporphyrin IX monomethyl ester cyclase
MNVCLIEPSKFVSLTNFVSTVNMPPIGLAYIAAAIREAGHQVSIVDGPGAAPRSYYNFEAFEGVRIRGLTNQQIIERIPENTDVIGLGCMFTSHWVLVQMLICGIRDKFPKAHLVMGGEHVTGFPEFSLQKSPLDSVVMGEGEETIVDLLKQIESGGSLQKVEGLAYRDADNKVCINSRRNRIREIDSIPWPAWDLFDIAKYNEVNQPHGASHGKFMPMLATRGCPYSCTFCTSPNMWTTRWIARNAKGVVDEIQHYYNVFRIRDFQFEDLTAIVNKNWVHQFCDEIILREITITFQLPSGTRSEAIDFELAQKLKKAGCHDFAFAPESGDPRVLKAIKKKVYLPDMFESAKAAMKAGINVGCYFILGFPEDDYKSVFKTYGAIIKCACLGFSHVNLNAYSPQPNTESFRKLQEDGVITELSNDYLLSLFTFQDHGAKKKSYNPRFKDYEITFLIAFGLVLFYAFYFLRRPSRCVQLVTELFTESSSNKTIRGAKSFLKEGLMVLKNKLRKSRENV